jgi:AcrR family transcriptional regulator
MATRLPAPARRDQLLAVAVEVFAREGFHATSMNDVAVKAGVTKPVLYQHFASKRELYLELLSAVGERLLDRIRRATGQATSPHEQVEQGFAAYFRWVAEDRDEFALLFGGGARRDEEFAGAVRAVEGHIAKAIAPLIAADIDPDHRQTLAYALVGLAEGTSRNLLARHAPFDPERLARQVADLAWAGLRGVRRV